MRRGMSAIPATACHEAGNGQEAFGDHLPVRFDAEHSQSPRGRGRRGLAVVDQDPRPVTKVVGGEFVRGVFEIGDHDPVVVEDRLVRQIGDESVGDEQHIVGGERVLGARPGRESTVASATGRAGPECRAVR